MTRFVPDRSSFAPLASMIAVAFIDVLAGQSVSASDGVLEINQTCATLSGCFSGDTPGFPVTIDGTAGSSYVLTSDLVVSDVNADGIFVSVARISIDLNGFGLSGPTVCSGTPVSCAPTGSGIGIHGGNLADGTIRELTVRDGRVHGFGASGLLLREAALVEGVQATSNGQSGISGGAGSVIRHCVAELNGSDGVKVDIGGVIENCASNQNHGRGIVASAGSTIANSTARKNDSMGILGTLGGGSAAQGVVIENNSSRENAQEGIFLASGGVARGNSVVLNGDDGIDGGDGTLIQDNAVVDNGNAPADDGIECDAGCSIQGNVIRANDGFGLNLGVGSAYNGNTVTSNLGGTVLGGTSRSDNYCDGAAAPACP